NLFFNSPDKANAFMSDLHNHTLIKHIKQDLLYFTCITIIDENYPSVLKPIKDSPFVFYAVGNKQLMNMKPSVNVILTRNDSKEAIPKLHHILNPLIKEGWVVVSGMTK